jgi:hypothetical protein
VTHTVQGLWHAASRPLPCLNSTPVRGACPPAQPTHPLPPPLQASVAYYLMADNRRRMPSSAYLREEMTEATDAALQYPSGECKTGAGAAGWG